MLRILIAINVRKQFDASLLKYENSSYQCQWSSIPELLVRVNSTNGLFLGSDDNKWELLISLL